MYRTWPQNNSKARGIQQPITTSSGWKFQEITQRAPDLKYLLHLDPGTPFRSKTTCNWASNNNGESGRSAPRVKWKQHREAEKEEEPWLNRVLRLRGLRFPLDLLCVPLLHHLQDCTRHHIRFLFTLETDILFNQVDPPSPSSPFPWWGFFFFFKCNWCNVLCWFLWVQSVFSLIWVWNFFW